MAVHLLFSCSYLWWCICYSAVHIYGCVSIRATCDCDSVCFEAQHVHVSVSEWGGGGRAVRRGSDGREVGTRSGSHVAGGCPCDWNT